jgi:hypothetical protein
MKSGARDSPQTGSLQSKSTIAATLSRMTLHPTLDHLRARLGAGWFSTVSSDGARAWLGVSDRHVIELVALEDCVRVSLRGTGERRDDRRVVVCARDLAVLDGLLDDARWWAGRLSVHRLVPGRAYRVIRDFRDFYEGAFVAGEVLHFVEQHFLPHDGGHTLVFRERGMYVQDETSAYTDFDALIEEA